MLTYESGTTEQRPGFCVVKPQQLIECWLDGQGQPHGVRQHVFSDTAPYAWLQWPNADGTTAGAENVLVVSPRVAMVPAEAKGQARELYALLHAGAAQNNVLADTVETPQALLAYDLPHLMMADIRQRFGSARMGNMVAGWVKLMGRLVSGRDTFVLLLEPWHFTLLAYQEKELFLCNTYELSGPADTVYYTMLAAEQLRIPLGTASVYIDSTDAEQAAQVSAFFTPYKKTEPLPLQEWLPPANGFSPGHLHATLSAALACVS